MNPAPRPCRSLLHTVAVLLTGFCTAILGATPALAEEVVDIPDPALRACVLAGLEDLGAPPELTRDNLARLTSLNCYPHDFGYTRDLTGVEALTGLEVFGAQGPMADLAPIGALTNLQTLHLYSELDPDLSVLSGLTSLRLLGIAFADTTDLSPIGGLAGLTRLILHGETATRLPDLTVPERTDQLSIRGSSLTALGRIAGPGVRTLYLYAQRLGSLQGVQGLTALTALYAGGSGLSDLSALAGMPRLATVSLHDNDQLQDLSGTGELASLTQLDVSGSDVRSVAPLTGARALTDLKLSGNRVTDLSPLAALPSLAALDAGDNEVAELGPAGGFGALTSVDLSGNRLESVGAFAGVRLSSVDLADNRLRDVSPLRGLAPDAVVHLERNHLRDLSPLPDSVTYHADEQQVSFPDPVVGTPVDLGIRAGDGHPVCPGFMPSAPCADGIVTYPASGTYRAWVMTTEWRQAGNLGFSFTVHAGPDRTFSTTEVPDLSDHGAPVVGGWLAADTSARWRPVPESFTYAWYRDGVVVEGTHPNDYSYALTAADLGHRIRVCSTAHLDGYEAKRVCSSSVGPVRAGRLYRVRTPRISSPGGIATGAVLTADPRTWDDGVTFSYQWQRNGHNIDGATAASFTVRARDVGDRLRVRVTGRKQGYHTERRYSSSVEPGPGTLTRGTPVVSADPADPLRFTADPGTWGPGIVRFGYQWYRGTKAIAGATGVSYQARASHTGWELSVRVSGRKAGYRTASRRSVPVLVAAP